MPAPPAAPVTPASLKLILTRDVVGEFNLWACRGTGGRGCRRNTHRTQPKPCDDCLGPLPPEMTLEQVMERLNRGDA